MSISVSNGGIGKNPSIDKVMGQLSIGNKGAAISGEMRKKVCERNGDSALFQPGPVNFGTFTMQLAKQVSQVETLNRERTVKEQGILK